MLLLLALLHLTACADLEPEYEPPERTSSDFGQANQAMVTDPSAQGPYGRCLDKRNWVRSTSPFLGDEVYLARIRFAPMQGSCSQARPGPLVVLLRAYGDYEYKKYDELAKHLVSHGYIVAWLDLEFPYQQIAEVNLDFMSDYLVSEWRHASAIDTSRVALVGHSRGAAAAALMAEQLENDATFDVDAIVSLVAGSYANRVPTRYQTGGMLMLHFTGDADVQARSSAEYFDAPLDGSYDRAFKLFEGGGHGTFLEPYSSEGATITRAYVLSFLDKHLRGDDTSYDAYIRNGAPVTWSGGGVSSQFKEAYVRTVDSFEDGTPGNNDLGGVVFRSGVNAVVRDLADYPASTIHKTNVLRVFAFGSNDHVTWRIPSANANTSLFETLSFRIGQFSGSSPSQDLTVQVRNGTTWSAEVPVLSGGEIGWPMTSCDQNQQTTPCTMYSDRDVMSTVRIPLSSFGFTNNVTRIRIRFRGDGVYKYFYIDDVELGGFAF